jgi:hypothetical protein
VHRLLSDEGHRGHLGTHQHMIVEHPSFSSPELKGCLLSRADPVRTPWPTTRPSLTIL